MSLGHMDAYVHIDTVPGESTASGFEKWIQITDFHHALNQGASSTTSSAGNHATGRVDVGQISFEKLVDSASPQLMLACCEGRHIEEVKFAFTRAGTTQNTYYNLVLKDAFITNVTQGARSRGADDLLGESVRLTFSTIEWTYQQTNQTGGGVSGSQATGWDAVKNERI